MDFFEFFIHDRLIYMVFRVYLHLQHLIFLIQEYQLVEIFVAKYSHYKITIYVCGTRTQFRLAVWITLYTGM